MYPRSFSLFVLLFCATGFLRAEDTALTRQSFESLWQLIQPQPDESAWAAIPWLINLQAARERAVQEDKPLFLWRSGGGDVLGRT